VPSSTAPFEVVVTQIGKEDNVRATAEELYQKLRAAGVDVLLDDRDERPGVKFKDADLIGFPLRIGVGAKSLANGQIEWSFRKDRAKQLGAADEVLARVIEEANKARLSA
jgi:prolyl-tRNA synthetase